jgi:hypothetical protein
MAYITMTFSLAALLLKLLNEPLSRSRTEIDNGAEAFHEETITHIANAAGLARENLGQ